MALDTTSRTFTGIAYAHRQCWCGISFAIPETLNAHYLDQNAREPGSYSIYCPLGHGMIPKGPSEADRLRQELQAANDRAARERHFREQAQAETEQVTRSLRGTRSVVTRMKRRTAKGRCVCCSRQFKDLEAHMKSKHPKWDPDRAAEALAATNSVR